MLLLCSADIGERRQRTDGWGLGSMADLYNFGKAAEKGPMRSSRITMDESRGKISMDLVRRGRDIERLEV